MKKYVKTLTQSDYNKADEYESLAELSYNDLIGAIEVFGSEYEILKGTELPEEEVSGEFARIGYGAYTIVNKVNVMGDDTYDLYKDTEIDEEEETALNDIIDYGDRYGTGILGHYIYEAVKELINEGKKDCTVQELACKLWEFDGWS